MENGCKNGNVNNEPSRICGTKIWSNSGTQPFFIHYRIEIGVTQKHNKHGRKRLKTGRIRKTVYHKPQGKGK